MQNELKNRREFFKEAARKALPIIGIIALTELPFSTVSAKKVILDCQTTCKGSCSGGCTYTCTGTCCQSCWTSCISLCKDEVANNSSIIQNDTLTKKTDTIPNDTIKFR